ncbi:uncharacterized protein J8A68_005600 [[Candida] subhashii]|uniref:Small ribosomal subunit protein uS7 domain-containing protein n=1 Tax=[Candida] subhashii TaxID=561895 RepID=A0A8J5QLW6_9ASCO|nr:uncharacterized protein J8A68_005600 [[Candida] subhashii]KAG7660925.1 hypothetical protein J8A68_005600 [[Candida] subhashii]
MSLVRNVLRIGARSVPASSFCGIQHISSIRYNSNQSSPSTTTGNPEVTNEKTPESITQQVKKKARKRDEVGLTAQLFPMNKDTISEQDLDNWIAAVQSLKKGKPVETSEQVYIKELTKTERFVEEKYEPTAEQLEEAAAYDNKQVPLLSDPDVDNLVNLVMRHGQKGAARKIVARAFYIVQLKTREDPVKIWKETLDKLAPLVKTRSMATKVAKSRVVPIPLSERQRHRYAITWILDASANKKSPDMAVRLAEEIISAWNGKSSGYDKKAQMHKTATQQRSYIVL